MAIVSEILNQFARLTDESMHRIEVRKCYRSSFPTNRQTSKSRTVTTLPGPERIAGVNLDTGDVFQTLAQCNFLRPETMRAVAQCTLVTFPDPNVLEAS